MNIPSSPGPPNRGALRSLSLILSRAAAWAFLSIASLPGCRVFPEWEKLEAVTPEPPQNWRQSGLSPTWEIEAEWSGGGCVLETDPEAVAYIHLPRDRGVVVLAYPVVNGRRLRPAGAVLPLAVPLDGELTLTWRDGYAAAAALVLLRAGRDPGAFDLDRFVSEAFRRMEDPWMIPPENFVCEFYEGSFRADWLDPPAVYPVGVSGIPGTAASDSPFGCDLEPDGEGACRAELPIGVHRWYADWGRVSVEVRGEGSAAWLVVR